MNRWISACSVLLVCVVFAGCNKPASDQDAIRATIEKRLTGRADLNLAAMDREVKQVSVNGDHASATVEFRLKGGDARMEVEYTLERKGKEWTVLNTRPMGGGGSLPGGEQAPPGAPDAGGNTMPPGHPSTN